MVNAKYPSNSIYLFYLCVQRHVYIHNVWNVQLFRESKCDRDRWVMKVTMTMVVQQYRWPSNILYNTVCVRPYMCISVLHALNTRLSATTVLLNICMNLACDFFFRFIYRVWHKLFVWVPVSDKTFPFANVFIQAIHGHKQSVFYLTYMPWACVCVCFCLYFFFLLIIL